MHEQRQDQNAGAQPAGAGGITRPRTEILRDVLLFQAKLFVDGVRDLLLVPVSLIAAVIDVLAAGKNTGQHFYEVVRFGRRTERWIGLFSAADHLDDQPHDAGTESIDQIVARVEGKLREQYEKQTRS